jgi:hypothetical protein
LLKFILVSFLLKIGFLIGYDKLKLLSGKVHILHHFFSYHPYQDSSCSGVIPTPFQIRKAVCQEDYFATPENSSRISFDFLVV